MNELVNLLTTLNPRNVLTEWENGKNFSQTIDENLEGFNLRGAILEYISLLDLDNKKDIEDYVLTLYDRCSQI